MPAGSSLIMIDGKVSLDMPISIASDGASSWMQAIYFSVFGSICTMAPRKYLYKPAFQLL